MPEKVRIFDFLQNQDLDDVWEQILGTKPFPPLKEVFAEIRREETRRKVMFLSLAKYNSRSSNVRICFGDKPK